MNPTSPSHTIAHTHIVYPVWAGQHGPEMPLGDVDQFPCMILSPAQASSENIALAEGAVKKFLKECF